MRLSYLDKNILVRLIVLVIADIELFWYVSSGWSNFITNNYIFVQIGLMTLLTICAFLTIKTLSQFVKGFEGEMDVKTILSKLPEEYIKFYDLNISNRGNIDASVIGPTGVWTIEVKSHKGNITFENNNLLINGFRPEKDFLSQAYAEAAALKDYLSLKMGYEIRVHPILVFSSRQTHMRFGEYPLKGVYVIGASWLIKLIQNRKVLLKSNDIQMLASIVSNKVVK